MRKFLLAGFISLPALFATAQKTVTLDGELKNIADPIEKVYLVFQANDNTVVDSVNVTDSKYHFSIKLEEPTVARLTARYKSGKNLGPGKMATYVFLDMVNMKAVQTDSFTNVKINGSKANDEFKKLTDGFKPLTQKRNELIQEYMRYRSENNKPEMDKLEVQIDGIDSVMNKSYATYVEKNPASPIAVFALQQFAGSNIVLADVEPLYKKLPKASQNTPSGKQLADALDIARKTGIGQTALDFTQNDTLGNPVSLSSFRGKYVLLDFWASWCGPCRAENPTVVKMYNTYKDKNFTVLGVSLDRPDGKEKWMKAIHDDHLTWTHVSDLKFWNNAVAKLYGIKGIPQNLLLDPQGKIIAKNVKGEELEKKLAEVLN